MSPSNLRGILEREGKRRRRKAFLPFEQHQRSIPVHQILTPPISASKTKWCTDSIWDKWEYRSDRAHKVKSVVLPSQELEQKNTVAEIKGLTLAFQVHFRVLAFIKLVCDGLHNFHLTVTFCFLVLRHLLCGVHSNFRPLVRAVFEEMLVGKKNKTINGHILVPLCLTKISVGRAAVIPYSLSPQGPLLHWPCVRLLHLHGDDSCDHTWSRRVRNWHRKRLKKDKHFLHCLWKPLSVHNGFVFGIRLDKMT